MRHLVVLIRHGVAVLLLEFRVQDRHGSVDSRAVSVVICRIVRHGAECKGILIHVPRIAEQRQDEIAAAYIVRQVAEERTPIRVVTQILNNRAAIRVRLPTIDFVFRGVRESLSYRRLNARFPHYVDNRLMRHHRIRFRLLRIYQQQGHNRQERKRFPEPAHNP